MLTKTKIILFFLIAISQTIYAQQLFHSPLTCKGKIPKDFIEIKKQINADRDKVDANFENTRKLWLKSVINSGQILFGDSITNYVNKVADIALASEPELRNQLRFYVLKSTIVNAFCTSEGMIFVTVGLLSQLENEAQLAFILCHEAIHFKKKHSIEMYNKIKNRYSTETREIDNFKFSKTQETEADLEGFEIFGQTKYKQTEAEASLDVLLYSYLPFQEKTWDFHHLEDSFYKFSPDLMLDSVAQISADEDEDDEESTHPNMLKRKLSLESSNDNGSLYLVGETEFELIQKLSRLELALLLITHADFEKAYYHAYLIENNYKNYVQFAKRIKTMAIYGIMIHSYDQGESNYKNATYSMFEGESQRTVYFFNKIKKKDLNIFAVREAFLAHNTYKSDPFFKQILDESMKSLFKNNSVNLKYFIKKEDYKAQINDTISSTHKKTKKIKKKNKDNFYSKMAFTQFLDDSYFNSLLTEAFNKNKKNNSDVESENDDTLNIVGKQKKTDLHKNNDKNFTIYDGHKIQFISPRVTYYVEKKDKRIFTKEDEFEQQLKEAIISNSQSLGINSEILEISNDENDVESWNNYMIEMMYISERINNDTTNMALYNESFIEPICKKNNISKIAISGMSIYKKLYFSSSSEALLLIAGTIYLPTTIPFVYYLFFKDRYIQSRYLFVFDINSHKITNYFYKESKSKPRKLDTLSENYNFLKNYKNGYKY